MYYHIFNRGINGENLFREERNYAYFLKLYTQHVEPVGETYAYCLLKNHFHLLVRIRDLQDPRPEPSQAFSNLFNAYGKAINKAYSRTGSLFQHPFGRILVTNDAYFCRLITYFHQNPRKHGFVADFRDWKYSSYHALIANGSTRLMRREVVTWFDSIEGFVAAHNRDVVDFEIVALAPDDVD